MRYAPRARMRLAPAFDAAAAACFVLNLVVVVVDVAGSFAEPPSPGAPRYLVYPEPSGGAPTKVQVIMGVGLPMEDEVSTIVGYVMKCNYNLPYNASYLSEPYVRYQRSAPQQPQPQAEEEQEEEEEPGWEESLNSFPGQPGRYEIYRMIELVVGSSGKEEEGKSCMLRAICEAAAAPFDRHHGGLLAQLLHLFLTPSSTAEAYTEPIDQEYLAAESMGLRGGPSECARSFTECTTNFLDYFTEIPDRDLNY